MQVFQLIEQMISNHTWLPLCAISDDAATKNIQYSIYKLVQELEPKRSYGYRVRICNSANNRVKIIGGGYSYLQTLNKLSVLLLLWSALSLTSCKPIYICTGSSAYAYHRDSTCVGLTQCKGEIKQVGYYDIFRTRHKCRFCYQFRTGATKSQ